MRSKKDIYFFFIIVIICAIVFFLFNRINNAASQNIVNSSDGYRQTISSAVKFYENKNRLRLDEYFTLNLMSERNVVFADVLRKNFNREEHSQNPFKRLLRRIDSLEDIKIIRKINTEKQVKQLTGQEMKVVPNYFYTVSAHGVRKDNYLEDPWDDLIVKALYCDISGFDTIDFELLKQLRQNMEGYGDTHFVVALLFLKYNRCYDQRVIEREIKGASERIIAGLDQDHSFNNLFSERVVFLYWAGYGNRVKREWIDVINRNFAQDYGWMDKDHTVSNPRTTGLSILALQYYLEGRNVQYFYR